MLGFLTLIEREYYRFARLAGQTILPPVIMTVLFVIIFGYSLGNQIETISGFPYIVYILPGLAGMGVITNSYSNSSTSLFMARIDRSIENILTAPLSPLEIVTAFVIGGMTRGLLVGSVTLTVAAILTNITLASLLLTAFFLIVISVTFSSLGIISALWAEDWDHLATFSNFVITPFAYLGGVFYSVTMLPPLWQKISYGNPMFYLIDGLRRAVLGKGDLSLGISLAAGSLLAGSTLAFAIYLFRKGYKVIV